MNRITLLGIAPKYADFSFEGLDLGPGHEGVCSVGDSKLTELILAKILLTTAKLLDKFDLNLLNRLSNS